MSSLRFTGVLLAAVLALGACAGGATPAATQRPVAPSAAPTGPVPSVSPPAPTATPPAPTPVETPGPTPSAAGVVLRATTTQALSPEFLFASLPLLVITADGRALTPAAQVAIYPGPLLPGVQEQTITPAGIARVVEAARAAGLLGAVGDFSGGAALPGAAVARLTIVADGTTYELSGPIGGAAACSAAQAGCPVPDPGTPAAFEWLWNGLTDLQGWLGSDLAPSARPFVAPAYGILVGPPPSDAMPGNPIRTWPLKDQPLAAFGAPFAIATFRCGSVTGDAATQLRPALEAANQLTAWVDDPSQSATRSVVVRPILPGDGDPCLPRE